MDGTHRVRRQVARLGAQVVPWGIGLLSVTTALEPREGWRQLAGLALAVLMSVALTRRSQRPELVTAVVLAATVPYTFLVPELVIPLAGMAAVWSLTLARPPSVSLVGLAALVAVAALNVLTTHIGDAVFTMCLSVAVWSLAEAARNRVEAARDAARQAAIDEKARIARELHDVIAHSVSVIVVQAAAAVDVFDTRPDQARDALQAIETTGRQALTELRRLLGAVDTTAAPTTPQPGLARLDELVAQVRSAGLDVVVSVSGAPVELPAGVDLSAYRIVQEALTNTLRHAQARTAEVSVAYLPGAVDIEVVDDGRAPPPAPGATTTGFGLIGMRERAAVLGGTLHAAPTAHGGFRVSAHLPLDPEIFPDPPPSPRSSSPAPKPGPPSSSSLPVAGPGPPPSVGPQRDVGLLADSSRSPVDSEPGPGPSPSSSLSVGPRRDVGLLAYSSLSARPALRVAEPGPSPSPSSLPLARPGRDVGLLADSSRSPVDSEPGPSPSPSSPPHPVAESERRAEAGSAAEAEVQAAT